MPESLFLTKLQLFLKETLAQMFSCKFCENFKNTFSYRAHPVAILFCFRIVLEYPLVKVVTCNIKCNHKEIASKFCFFPPAIKQT